MHLVLHPRAGPHQPRPSRDTPPQRGRRLIRHPHRFEHSGGEELGEHRRVEAVGLHTRVRDRTRLGRIAHHHPPHGPFSEQPGDHHRAAARLQHHLVTALQAGRKLPDRLRGTRDPPDTRNPAALGDRDLAEIEVNIQTKEPHENRLPHKLNRPAFPGGLGLARL